MAAAKPKKTAAKKAGKPPTKKAAKPARLPKSDGDAGVKAYIASMEPWQGALVKRIDTLVAKQVPDVRRAIKWHTPMYGLEGKGWFLAVGGFQHYVKLNFFVGRELKPEPPGGDGKLMRFLDVRETDKLDERQLTSWIKQASSIQGWGKV